MRAAAAGRGESSLTILGVTVLTSLSQDDLLEDGYAPGLAIEDLVLKKVRTGLASGINGFVCSPLEVARVRALTGPSGVLVTPGVRSVGATTGDQKRVATPREAMQNGASYLVIGRQITRAANPAAAAQEILAEIEGAASPHP
jgi:orotidine-5'-phosphate decarboxylase